MNRSSTVAEKPVDSKKQSKDSRFAHIQPTGSWEIPRKVYHYSNGYDTTDVIPYLVAYLALVLTGEVLRFSFDWFNVLYCRILGPLMRQTEIKSRWNGVVYYLAASICGRLWGRYTPRFGKKSLAGTSGAMIIGALVTYAFYQKRGSSYMTEAHVPLSVLSVYGGVVAGLSEAMADTVGLDDNFIIPVLSGILLWIPLVGLGLGKI
ncbi:phosphatidate cytidylyltransferase [Radiomyces spectabilis]|uniref:phosphatidate cytidylyltransferase n=1 Tax=Radiomyces spectabilis TaxID=64574 RepID=UPI00221EBDAB|nr:phosphatidate cytidylyltransferase [Radiomyces spectabilis]KAI8368276.1 phosphatidate cytidylyltransferase [Radiomyces spectabilis]